MQARRAPRAPIVPAVLGLVLWAQAVGADDITEGLPLPPIDGPRFVCDEPRYDFGSVEQGATVHHVFRFRNEGNAPLEIDDVISPCGCTAVAVPTTSVLPGEEGTIEVLFDTAQFRGRKTKSIFLATNDPVHAMHDVTVTGEVAYNVVADPPVLYLGRVDPGAGARAQIRVLSTRGDALRIAVAESDHPGVHVSAEPPPASGPAAQMALVTVDGGMPRGPFSATVRVAVESAGRTELEIPLLGTVAGDLIVTPPHVTMGVGGARRYRGEERTLEVRNRGVEPIAISGVSVPDLPLDYAVRTLRAGYTYEITLRLTAPKTFEEERRGSVHIYTTHPDEPELIVPVYAALRSDL
jgi:hypothetical protein